MAGRRGLVEVQATEPSAVRRCCYRAAGLDWKDEVMWEERDPRRLPAAPFRFAKGRQTTEMQGV